jgi:sugar/nucleoside kinase (ribokinase family)
MAKISVSCAGCSLVDYLYADIDFGSQAFKRCLSKKQGDGGLEPGHLVFLDEFERFAGAKFEGILKEIAGDKKPDAVNLGGPAVVALINCAQLLEEDGGSAHFYGAMGKDSSAKIIRDILSKTPVDFKNYITKDGATPFTNVFSDPGHSGGKGERTFINNIGAAWNYTPEDIGADFFKSDILVYGGTALVPRIHDALTELLQKGKDAGRVSVVNTVFDFRNEKRNPDGRWPLGNSDKSFPMIDLLIVDMQEALRISGTRTLDDAVSFLTAQKTPAFIITHGAQNLTLYSDGSLFQKTGVTRLPVSEAVVSELTANPALKGDTTGCGDNFAGGVIASAARQILSKEKGRLDLAEAAAWGVASGGFACFYIGGTYLEKNRGEKAAKIASYYNKYRQQISGVHKLPEHK